MLKFSEVYLSKKPFASDDLRNGIFRQTQGKALGMKFIESNPLNIKNLLIVDCDSEDSVWDLKSKIFDDEILPVPYYITTNPITQHSHAAWLTDGIATTERARYSFDVLRKKLSVVADGDENYTGMITRNPVHGDQITEWMTDKAYTFAELSHFTKGVILEERKAYSEALDSSLGRNCFLFDKSRQWSYGAYYKALKEGTAQFFHETLSDYVKTENMLMAKPLPQSEVRSIVKSNYYFLIKKFSIDKFEQTMEARREKSLEVRREKAFMKYLAIKEIMIETDSTLKLACETLGHSYGSVRNVWKKWEETYGSFLASE